MIKLFLDTADPSQASPGLDIGLFWGVTTNPNLAKLARLPYRPTELGRMVRQMFQLGAKEVHLQSWGADEQSLYLNGLTLADLDPGVAVKVPATPEGFKAASRLVRAGKRVTLTAVYAVAQAVAAVAIGVHYVAPYLGRMNDAGKEGLHEISQMSRILHSSGSSTELLVASLRSLDELVVLAGEGVTGFTLAPMLAEQLLHEPLSLEAAKVFEGAVSECLEEGFGAEEP